MSVVSRIAAMSAREVVVEEEEEIEEIETTTADPGFQLDPAQVAELMGAQGNAGLLSALQGRLDQMIGKPSGYIETLPKPVQNRIAFLGELQEQHDELEEKMHEEQQALLRKYAGLWKPIFDKRAAIVQGKEEAPDTLPSDQEEQSGANEDEEGDVPSGIPNFWLSVLQSHKHLCETLEEKDIPILEHLVDLQHINLRDEEPSTSTKSEDSEDEDDEKPKGFRLIFSFSQNPYFSNKQLVKTYYMAEEDESNPILQKATGTTIDWASGKNPGVKIQKKKATGKGKKPGVRTSRVPTFFDFFSPAVVPDTEDELTPEQMENLQESLEQDYELGEVLKDDIIPYAIKWFTGEAQMEDSDEEYDDEDDEDEEGAEDDDEEEEEQAPVRQVKAAKKTTVKAAGTQAKGGAEAKDNPPDCKQQ